MHRLVGRRAPRRGAGLWTLGGTAGHADAGACLNSPSHRAITTVARQLPTTFTDVRAMSINSSMPRIARMGHSGRPNDAAVPSRITSVARGTPATPLLVSI